MCCLHRNLTIYHLTNHSIDGPDMRYRNQQMCSFAIIVYCEQIHKYRWQTDGAAQRGVARKQMDMVALSFDWEAEWLRRRKTFPMSPHLIHSVFCVCGPTFIGVSCASSAIFLLHSGDVSFGSAIVVREFVCVWGGCGGGIFITFCLSGISYIWTALTHNTWIMRSFSQQKINFFYSQMFPVRVYSTC